MYAFKILVLLKDDSLSPFWKEFTFEFKYTRIKLVQLIKKLNLMSIIGHSKKKINGK